MDTRENVENPKKDKLPGGMVTTLSFIAGASESPRTLQSYAGAIEETETNGIRQEYVTFGKGFFIFTYKGRQPQSIAYGEKNTKGIVNITPVPDSYEKLLLALREQASKKTK